MKLYNTLTRTTEDFKPLQDNTVSLYTCGLTVYSQPHIGNWVAYIYWDILVRTLTAEGYRVNRVQNITDVGHLTSDEDAGEDKMLKGALQEGLTAWEVAEKYIAIADDEAYTQLGLIRPTHMPRATEYIPQQIAFVQALEQKGFTYTIQDGVYFDTSKLNDYGKLARLDIDGLQFGARVEDTGKKNPTDFALWKFSPNNQKRDMEWWAPWSNPLNENNEMHVIGALRDMHTDILQGDNEHRSKTYTNTAKREAQLSTQQYAESNTGIDGYAGEQGIAVHGSWGFPGWHLECSVMARELLGDTIDIHTGGIDHIPVHHTNEIAQSEAFTGKPFANNWVHANHLKVEGTKISKSLGNGYTLTDITEKGYSLNAFKLMVISKHYRTEGNFTWEILEAAQNRLTGFRALAALKYQAKTDAPKLDQGYFTAKTDAIKQALFDDLNTPEALVIINEVATHIEFLHTADVDNFNLFLSSIDELLGLRISKEEDITEEQKNLIIHREKVREQKNWHESDTLRDQLFTQNIVVRDTAHGTIWSRV